MPSITWYRKFDYPPWSTMDAQLICHPERQLMVMQSLSSSPGKLSDPLVQASSYCSSMFPIEISWQQMFSVLDELAVIVRFSRSKKAITSIGATLVPNDMMSEKSRPGWPVRLSTSFVALSTFASFCTFGPLAAFAVPLSWQLDINSHYSIPGSKNPQRYKMI